MEEALREFHDNVDLYERFTNKLHELIKEFLDDDQIRCSTEARTKPDNSLHRKILNPDKGYKDPLREITDLCAVRVITRLLSDALKVVEIIRREFVIDEKNSVYKAEELKVDQFGYTSIHLVVSLPTHRCELTEWKSFKDLRAEIQIRTQLQHAWAVISHAFDYKTSADMPTDPRLRRRLFRLSALFELADEELDHIVDEISRNIESYRLSIEHGNTEIELNVDSLRTYLESSPDFKYWIDEVENIIGKAPTGFSDLSRSIRIAEFCGLSTLDAVTKNIRLAHGWGERLLADYYESLITETNFPKDKIAPTLDGISNLLLIAANADRFTSETLHNDLGYAKSPVLNLILTSKTVKA